jgi:hypothetical protein
MRKLFLVKLLTYSRKRLRKLKELKFFLISLLNVLNLVNMSNVLSNLARKAVFKLQLAIRLKRKMNVKIMSQNLL